MKRVFVGVVMDVGDVVVGGGGGSGNLLNFVTGAYKWIL